jgi:hypothetical protein
MEKVGSFCWQALTQNRLMGGASSDGEGGRLLLAGAARAPPKDLNP